MFNNFLANLFEKVLFGFYSVVDFVGYVACCVYLGTVWLIMSILLACIYVLLLPAKLLSVLWAIMTTGKYCRNVSIVNKDDKNAKDG